MASYNDLANEICRHYLAYLTTTSSMFVVVVVVVVVY